jgi:hypothetical protein
VIGFRRWRRMSIIHLELSSLRRMSLLRMVEWGVVHSKF